MSPNLIDESVIAEAEQLVLSLKNHTGEPADQTKVVRQLDKLRCLVHNGFDALLYQAQPFQILPALKVLIDHGVFDSVPLDDNISEADLAAAVKLDGATLRRFLCLVRTQGIFVEIAPGIVKHTPASAVFRSDQAASFFRLGTTQFPQWWKVSDYLGTHSIQDAQDATKVPYVWAQGKEGKTYYEAMEEDPEMSDAWHKGMILIESTQPVTGMFPFRSLQAEVEREAHRPFVVDVGGGRGNALVAIMKECGGSFGARMVLQDMNEVLNGKDPVQLEGVENIAHNFYDPQPVKDAHIYYLRNVLHNHYDERSKVILQHIVDAMGSSSRVLICEMILPQTSHAGSDPFPFFMDLNMFMEGGVERTLEDWMQLLDSVGLRIEKVWRQAHNPVQSTIEARRKD